MRRRRGVELVRLLRLITDDADSIDESVDSAEVAAMVAVMAAVAVVAVVAVCVAVKLKQAGMHARLSDYTSTMRCCGSRRQRTDHHGARRHFKLVPPVVSEAATSRCSSPRKTLGQ